MQVRTGFTRSGKRVNYVVPADRGVETPEHDSKDCVVRAVCNVTGKSHEEVSRVAAALGRVNNKGCHSELTVAILRHFGLHLRATCGTTIMAREYTRIAEMLGVSYRRCAGVTIARALCSMSQGKWVVLRRGHAFAVIDGKIIDKTPNSPDASVVAVFRLPD